MSFIEDVIKLWAKTATEQEIHNVKKLVDSIPLFENIESEVIRIRKEEGLLSAVKYVNNRTGWGLKASKEYVDNLL